MFSDSAFMYTIHNKSAIIAFFLTFNSIEFGTVQTPLSSTHGT